MTKARQVVALGKTPAGGDSYRLVYVPPPPNVRQRGYFMLEMLDSDALDQARWLACKDKVHKDGCINGDSPLGVVLHALAFRNKAEEE